MLSQDCPAGLCQIIARCLAKDKHERYPHAGDIAADLRRYRDIVPDPVLIGSAYASVAAPAKAAKPTADQTQRLQPPPDKLRMARPKWAWPAGIGLVTALVIGASAWKLAAGPATPAEPDTTTSTRSVTTTTQGKSSNSNDSQAEKRSATAKKPASTTTKNTTNQPKKGFWRRQVDCFKYGNCDKAAPPPNVPPEFSP